MTVDSVSEAQNGPVGKPAVTGVFIDRQKILRGQVLALLLSLLGGGGGGLPHHRVLEDLGDGGGLVLQHLDGLLHEHLGGEDPRALHREDEVVLDLARVRRGGGVRDEVVLDLARVRWGGWGLG